MLFMINEYAAEYPEYNVSIFAKFADTPKNLHEMSLDEINEIVGEWKPLSENTVIYYQKSIRYYLEWLQDKGVKTDPSIARKIQFPLAENEYLIFSTKDISHYFDELYKCLEKMSVLDGVEYNREPFYMCHAADILSFYGLTTEQIINLKLSDVQQTGIIGYDLPLTKDDIDILLRYKHMTNIGIRKTLKGVSYIRATREIEIDKRFLSKPLQKIKVTEEYEYLKKLLTVNNIHVLGIYDRLYQIEKQKGEYIAMRNNDPQWFADAFKTIGTKVLTPYKKAYVEYRAERDNAAVSEPEPIVVSKPEPKVVVKPAANRDQLTMRLNNLLTIMRGVCTEIEKIKEEVDKLK